MPAGAVPPPRRRSHPTRPAIDSGRPAPTGGHQPVVHASRIRPDAGPLDRRRLAAAGLSALLPGLGQAFNRRPRLALLFLIPSLVVLGGRRPALADARARRGSWPGRSPPSVMGTLLTLNLLLLVWRLRRDVPGLPRHQAVTARPRGSASSASLVLTVLVVVPHVLVYSYGSALSRTLREVFSGGALGATSGDVTARRRRSTSASTSCSSASTRAAAHDDPDRHDDGRLARPGRQDRLDGVGAARPHRRPARQRRHVRTEAQLAVRLRRAPPRRTSRKGGSRALEDAIGALLGIHIDYYATMDFDGLIKMVDAVGGVDIDVKDGVRRPDLRRATAVPSAASRSRTGHHHLDGVDALAYARSRKAARRERLRPGRPAAGDPAWRCATRRRRTARCCSSCPSCSTPSATTVRTDLPVDRLPQLAALADEVGRRRRSPASSSATRSSRSKSTQYGSSLIPDLTAIRAVAARALPDARRVTPSRGRPRSRRRRRPPPPSPRPDRGQAGGGAQRAPGGDHDSNRPSRVSRSGSRISRPRCVRRHEAGLDRVVEPGEERPPVAVGVEQADRLGVQVELGPRGDLGQLLERAQAAGQRDERVGELTHACLALVERRRRRRGGSARDGPARGRPGAAG